MKFFEKLLGKPAEPLTPEQERERERTAPLLARIKELEKERDRLNADERFLTGNLGGGVPKPLSRQSQINQEIENLHLEIKKLPPLHFPNGVC
jgi:hypothetical protein